MSPKATALLCFCTLLSYCSFVYASDGDALQRTNLHDLVDDADTHVSIRRSLIPEGCEGSSILLPICLATAVLYFPFAAFQVVFSVATILFLGKFGLVVPI